MFSEVPDCCLLHKWVLSVMWECSDSNVAGEDQPSWLTLVTTEESILSPQWYCPLHTESHSGAETSERDWCDSVWCHSSESHSVSHSTVVTAEVTLITQYTVTHRAWSVEAAVTAGGCCDHPRLLSPAVTSCHTTTSTDWREEFLQLCRYEVLNKIIILSLMRSSNGMTQFHRTLQASAMITQPSHPSSSLCRLMQLSKVVMWENSGMHHYYCQELLHIKLTLSTTPDLLKNVITYKQSSLWLGPIILCKMMGEWGEQEGMDAVNT